MSLPVYLSLSVSHSVLSVSLVILVCHPCRLFLSLTLSSLSLSLSLPSPVSLVSLSRLVPHSFQMSTPQTPFATRQRNSLQHSRMSVQREYCLSHTRSSVDSQFPLKREESKPGDELSLSLSLSLSHSVSVCICLSLCLSVSLC